MKLHRFSGKEDNLQEKDQTPEADRHKSEKK